MATLMFVVKCTTSTVDELTEIDDLHRRGLLSDAVFERERTKALM